MRSQQGFSLIELVVVVAISSVLAVIVTGQFRNNKDQADTKTAIGVLDTQASAAMAWASEQEGFVDGSRFSIPESSSCKLACRIMSAQEGKQLSDADAASQYETVTGVNDLPSANNKTALFTDVTLDGERIRLTRCSSYFDNGDRLCARTDIFPWGNNTEDAPSVVYRYLQCAGSGCSTRPVYSGNKCRSWPKKLPDKNNNGAFGPLCPSATSQSQSSTGALTNPIADPGSGLDPNP